MELRFLGQVYSTSNVQVETVPSDLTVCLRGQAYNLRRPIQTAEIAIWAQNISWRSIW